LGRFFFVVVGPRMPAMEFAVAGPIVVVLVILVVVSVEPRRELRCETSCRNVDHKTKSEQPSMLMQWYEPRQHQTLMY